MFTMEKKVWPSLGKFYLFYPLIFPKKQSTLSKKRAKNLTCAHARSLWSKGRWKPCVWGWFSCIMVAGISSGVREIEIWRYLDFRSNFPLLFCVCILCNFRAIQRPKQGFIDPVLHCFLGQDSFLLFWFFLLLSDSIRIWGEDAHRFEISLQVKVQLRTWYFCPFLLLMFYSDLLDQMACQLRSDIHEL